jgi:hypothetical protein
MIGVEKSRRKTSAYSSLFPLRELLGKMYLRSFSELEFSQEGLRKCFYGEIKLAARSPIFENFHGQYTPSP